jgi:hypothetical protein
MCTAVNAELVGDALLWPSKDDDPTSGWCTTPTAARFTSLAFSSRLADLELDQSFSAVGSCYDNAAVESFFATVKT